MPNVDFELELRREGYRTLAGIDEAGRGCWAGPVVAAAVVLRADALAQPSLLQGIDDSKRLSPAQREALLPTIHAVAVGIGVAGTPAFLIDSLGIVGATRLAMELAVLQLPCWPDALIVDALRLPGLPIAQRAIIGADHLSYSVAAASIVAKTTRDRWMSAIERDEQRYGFALHKGYGTAWHRAALRRWGPCGEHRRSFRPLWNEEAYDN
jgi:ribonuclease HII